MQKEEGFKVGKSTTVSAGTFAGLSVAMPSIPAPPSASVPASVPSKIPTMPDIAEPPRQINTPAGAGAGRGAVNVTMPEQIGQNVGDRATAHIVTGGMGSRS